MSCGPHKIGFQDLAPSNCLKKRQQCISFYMLIILREDINLWWPNEQEEGRDEVLKIENVWGSWTEENVRLSRGKYWQSDRLCKVFRPYCLRYLCLSHYGVLSLKMRLLCLRRATVGPPGPHNRESMCVPNLESSSLVVLKCGLLCLFLCVCEYEREN